MKILNLEPCVAPKWVKGGHAQTLVGHFLPSPVLAHESERFEVELPDGDRLIGRLYRGKSKTTVSVFHGLTGSISSAYMQRTAAVALSLGHSVLLMNHRGCGEGKGAAKLPYHSGRAEDLSAVFEKLRKVQPDFRQVGIGFSLGANALLLLASGERGACAPDAAIAFNAPIHLEDSAKKLKVGLNRLYDLQFVIACRRDVFRRHLGDEAYKKIEFPMFGTLHDFDDWYTAPASGFKNREDYYRSCSTFERLEKIEIPTIIITAEDDPFVSAEFYKSAKLSPSTQVHIEKVGGHMGYISARKTPLGTNRWLDYAVHEALVSLA